MMGCMKDLQPPLRLRLNGVWQNCVAVLLLHKIEMNFDESCLPFWDSHLT